MRTYETKVQELQSLVMREVAKLAWEDKLHSGVLDIPERIIPGPDATMRCCIYKERAVIGSRIKLAMGGDMANPNLVEVMSIACDECPVTEITVGPACRGCIATRCVHSCPRKAITIVNHHAVIDADKCVSCGKCISACPYSAIMRNRRPCEQGCLAGAISMHPEDKKASIDHNKCISCGACTYQCPFGAIIDKSYLLSAIQMLRGAEAWGYRVYAIVAPAIAGQFAPATAGQVVSGLRKLGFAEVCEVAAGADAVALEEGAELAERGMLATSCCPAFVSYVEKNFPEQAELISNTPSPMVMTARAIKERDPDARVIFIGPCVAKKREFQLGKTMGAVDCVLTFAELWSLMAARDIDPEVLEETSLCEASSFGRGFAASGGVTAAVLQALREQKIEFEVKPEQCNGIEACRTAFLKTARNAGDFNFIEGMACVGGCMQGPGNLVRSPRNKMEVEKHAKAGKKKIIDGE